jgi:hypothetical protein
MSRFIVKSVYEPNVLVVEKRTLPAQPPGAAASAEGDCWHRPKV